MSFVLAIDFDGTIVTPKYPEVGELKPNAKKYLTLLYEEGFHLTIWTCRYGYAATLAQQFLADSGISYHQFNEAHPQCVAFFQNDTRKIPADIYIDDRQLGGIPDDWELIYQLIHKHCSYIQAQSKILSVSK